MAATRSASRVTETFRLPGEVIPLSYRYRLNGPRRSDAAEGPDPVGAGADADVGGHPGGLEPARAPRVHVEFGWPPSRGQRGGGGSGPVPEDAQVAALQVARRQAGQVGR